MGRNGDAVNLKGATVREGVAEPDRASRASRLLPGAYFGWAQECTLAQSIQPCATTPGLEDLTPPSNERRSPTPRTFAEITESCGNGLGCVRLPSSLATLVCACWNLCKQHPSHIAGKAFDRPRAFPTTSPCALAALLSCRGDVM